VPFEQSLARFVDRSLGLGARLADDGGGNGTESSSQQKAGEQEQCSNVTRQQQLR
jgi:hypothetical protein